MVTGVIAFSFASGSLTNFIQQEDRKGELYEKKMSVLDKLFRETVFPPGLYTEIKKNLKGNYSEDVKSVSEFVDDLPLNLKQQLAIHIY